MQLKYFFQTLTTKYPHVEVREQDFGHELGWNTNKVVLNSVHLEIEDLDLRGIIFNADITTISEHTLELKL